MSELLPGIYRHYKGGLYRVIGEAVHTETEEALVAYEPADGSDKRMFVRPLQMFFDVVEVGQQQFPRFSFIGNELPVETTIASEEYSGHDH